VVYLAKRSFNTTGTCRPDTDYMVDIGDRVEKVKEMVDRGKYFTINRPRQYGKTTLISALTRRLYDGYICVRLSFEGLGEESFYNSAAFCTALLRKIKAALTKPQFDYDKEYANQWEDPSVTDFIHLGEHITKMCKGKKVVLIIDEVDKTSNNIIFLHFIGLLREKFLMRKDGLDDTFLSVILAGVHDIRNLKLKLINEGIDKPSGRRGSHLNSPWNIAAPFLVDLSFNPNDIAGMLNEYEGEHSTGMDTAIVSRAIYEYTGGYPFLVSQICQLLDEDDSLGHDWSPVGIYNAVKALIRQNYTLFGQNNTLFDDISKNLENYPDLYSFIYDILIIGKRKTYTITVPTIQQAAMLGFIRNEDGQALISNRIFEIIISDYFIAKDEEYRSHSVINGYQGDMIKNGRFDMEYCLIKFARLFRELYTDKDSPFVEEHGRMLFLTYLKPLINGAGFYHIESRLTDQRRMDLVVDYGLDQFIIELKLWYGESAHEKAFDQLAGYLKSKYFTTGYLVTFDFRKNKNRAGKAQWVEWGDTRIFNVII